MNKIWYEGRGGLQYLLSPLAFIYQLIVRVRRTYLERFCQINCPVPVIVVGNISVGGVGKTPLVIALAQQFKEKGLRVGVVSRGYGSQVHSFPYEVSITDEALLVGDEPLLIARKTQCPVVIARKRTQAINYLLEKHQSQIILSDDGLQHYRMGRAIEIAVVDGTRGLGNGFCLPAGPLRESAKRLNQVDFIVVNEGKWPNAYSMHLKPEPLTQLNTGAVIQADQIQGQIAAVAGIGNPKRFYSTLNNLGIKFDPYSYPDHHQFKLSDIELGADAVIMTEKDAIKCSAFNTDKLYCLPVKAVLDDSFWMALWSHQHLQGYC